MRPFKKQDVYSSIGLLSIKSSTPALDVTCTAALVNKFVL